MKDNWNELFDHLNEEDILRNLPEDLPEMEDELAAKRMEDCVMQEMKIDLEMQKKQKRKQPRKQRKQQRKSRKRKPQNKIEVH